MQNDISSPTPLSTLEQTYHTLGITLILLTSIALQITLAFWLGIKIFQWGSIFPVATLVMWGFMLKVIYKTLDDDDEPTPTGINLDLSANPKLQSIYVEAAEKVGVKPPQKIRIDDSIVTRVTYPYSTVLRFGQPEYSIGLPLLASMTVDEIRAAITSDYVSLVRQKRFLPTYLRVLDRYAMGFHSHLVHLRGAALFYRLARWASERIVSPISHAMTYETDRMTVRHIASETYASMLKRLYWAQGVEHLLYTGEMHQAFQHGMLPSVIEGFDSYLNAPRPNELYDGHIAQKLHEVTQTSNLEAASLSDRLQCLGLTCGEPEQSDQPKGTSLLEFPGKLDRALMKLVFAEYSKGGTAFQRTWSEVALMTVLPGLVIEMQRVRRIIGDLPLSRCPGAIDRHIIALSDTLEKGNKTHNDIKVTALGALLIPRAVNLGWRYRNGLGYGHRLDKNGVALDVDQLLWQVWNHDEDGVAAWEMMVAAHGFDRRLTSGNDRVH